MSSFEKTLTVCLILVAVVLGGCSDDRATVREIQSRRQEKLQTQSKQDHLGEAFNLLSKIITLNIQQAQRQIAYHVNEWALTRPTIQANEPPKLLESIDDVFRGKGATERIASVKFLPSDVNYLRDCYVFRRISQWANAEQRDDPVLRDWIVQQQDELGEEVGDQLLTASRMFDWTVRNVAIEPMELPGNAPKELSLPFDMKFGGPAYRQSDYRTVSRGTGDPWSRAGVFTQLCRQANLRAAVLAVQSTETGDLSPWCVGVFIGKEVYLFEPQLGCHIPGPNQIGIATLREARSDALVMRRLNIPGLFDYPLGKDDVQQSVALLNVMPEAFSARMKLLSEGLTGDRRLNAYADGQELSQKLDEYVGIAGVQVWKAPILQELYRAELERVADRDPIFSYLYYSRWAILESEHTSSNNLASGRWRHLTGKFRSEDDDFDKGALNIYLDQRRPEFEIKDLDIDVDLQKAYGIRQDLGISAEEYQRQIIQIQVMMRLGKRTATYWLSLLQYDDSELESAKSWLEKRVLDKEQLSFWEPAARYNLGRTLEQLGQYEKAIEIYKTEGDPQEHGNRIRARLLAKLEQ